MTTQRDVTSKIAAGRICIQNGFPSERRPYFLCTRKIPYMSYNKYTLLLTGLSTILFSFVFCSFLGISM